MKVLVCGGRDFGEMSPYVARGTDDYYREARRVRDDRHLLNVTLNALQQCPTVIIHGAARGADRLADNWAKACGVRRLPFVANWYPNGRKGGLDRSAGPRRNQAMLEEGQPDLVIAFPGGDGTADMVRRAKSAGVKVVEVPRPHDGQS